MGSTAEQIAKEAGIAAFEDAKRYVREWIPKCPSCRYHGIIESGGPAGPSYVCRHSRVGDGKITPVPREHFCSFHPDIPKSI